MPYPDPFYPVVDSVAWVSRLTKLGVGTVQLRAKNLDESSHDENELDNALAYKPDYIALGPIYETTLKKMRFAPQGIERITAWKLLIGDIPLVAIGGIKLEQAELIFAAGANSIAVVSDVTMNEDPDARVRAWLQNTSQAA